MRIIQVNFPAVKVFVSPGRNNYYVDIETDVESSEADDIFDMIKDHVDHDKMMDCLAEFEVLEYFKIDGDG